MERIKALGILDEIKARRRRNKGKIRKLNGALSASEDGGDTTAVGPAVAAGSITGAQEQ